MQRILDPARIEAFAERDIPRVRLPDPDVFGQRGRRLRALGANHSLRDYLLLMAALADAQQAELDSLRSALAGEGFAGALGQQIELAHAHRMPVLQAVGWPRQDRWRAIARALCRAISRSEIQAPRGVRESAVDAAETRSSPTFPPAVYALCARIADASDSDLDTQADLLISARTDGVNAPAAPFIMGALQVYWAAMVSTLRVTDVASLDVPTVCPVCGSLPIASVVRADKRGPQGYRYLHCGLCETEWHMVRITCSHCLTTEGITYHSIEGGSEAVRAETCGKCHTYRKILYQEKDNEVEPVADDLASLALDLLMTEEGFHRGSGNPLLWQTSET
jgi:FdhE protein